MKREELGMDFHVWAQSPHIFHSQPCIDDRQGLLCLQTVKHSFVPLPLLLSGASVVEGTIASVGRGLFGSVQPFASPGHNSELWVACFSHPSLQLGDRKRLSATVELLCLVSVAMALCRDGKECSTQMPDLKESPC